MKTSILTAPVFLAAIAICLSCSRDNGIQEGERVNLSGFEDKILAFDDETGTTFTVDANRDWRISRGTSNWIDVIPNQGRAGKPADVRIVVERNYASRRQGTLHFTCGNVTRSITVIQEASPIVVNFEIGGLDKNSIEFSGDATGTKTFTVKCNSDWTATADGLDWLQLTPLSGKAGEQVEIQVTPSVNEGLPRSGTICLSALGAETVVINVSQGMIEFTDPIWEWTIDEKHIKEHLAAYDEVAENNTFIISDDHFRGNLLFIHTHNPEDYVTEYTPEIPDRVSYADYRPASSTTPAGYGYLGGLAGDYWEFRCPVSGTITAGTVIHVRMLVMGGNQSAAFWNGSWSADDGQENLLHVENRNYKGGGKATKPTWDIWETCSYILGWDLPGNNTIIPHLIEENITLNTDVTREFRFRLTIVSDVFTKAIIEWENATSRSFPSMSLGLVPSAAGYVGQNEKALIEAL